uniref:Alternative protein PRDM16 n=1 Tax=Homo sapiens TaxID=9606 RepID=L8E8P9_HUMAN|nr:alternative protein PRDM16 [Homo sapiens]
MSPTGTCWPATARRTRPRTVPCRPSPWGHRPPSPPARTSPPRRARRTRPLSTFLKTFRSQQTSSSESPPSQGLAWGSGPRGRWKPGRGWAPAWWCPGRRQRRQTSDGSKY